MSSVMSQGAEDSTLHLTDHVTCCFTTVLLKILEVYDFLTMIQNLL
jgi:hypothetical protein